MNVSGSALKAISVTVLIGIFCGSASALKVIAPPLETGKLPGVWVSPVGEFAQARLVIPTSGNATFVLAPYRSTEELHAYSASKIELHQYSLSLVLQPLSRGGAVEVSGYAQEGELTLFLPEEAGVADALAVKLVPVELARRELQDIERLQALLTDLSKAGGF